jgi:hypothetical protein
MATHFVSTKLSAIAFAGLVYLTAFAVQTTGQTATDQLRDDGASDQALNEEVKELRRLVQDALARMSELARKLESRSPDANFQQQLDDERAHLQVCLFWWGHREESNAGPGHVNTLLKAQFLGKPLQSLLLVSDRNRNTRKSINTGHSCSPS